MFEKKPYWKIWHQICARMDLDIHTPEHMTVKELLYSTWCISDENHLSLHLITYADADVWFSSGWTIMLHFEQFNWFSVSGLVPGNTNVLLLRFLLSAAERSLEPCFPVCLQISPCVTVKWNDRPIDFPQTDRNDRVQPALADAAQLF